VFDDTKRPRILEGGLHVDVRGTVSFINDFDFRGVDRFYSIRSHRPFEPRGWRGHQREHKWFTVVQGSVLVAVVRPDNWDFPDHSLPVERFILSAAKPCILQVPAGNATGSLSLSEDAILMVFSSGKIQDADDDTYPFPVGTWEISG
jgi:dTDP-4-dehydrorhamnose 3,5-epimerase-like enzyme